MDVVVLVLIESSTHVLSALFDRTSRSSVLSQVPLLRKSLLMFRSHFLLVFSGDHRFGGVDMFGVEGLLVLNRLKSVLELICKSCVMVVGIWEKKTYLKVVNMSLAVDGFSGLNTFLRPDMFLDDLGGGVCADLLPKVKRMHRLKENDKDALQWFRAC